MIIMAHSISILLEHLHFALLTLKSLGFIPNKEKSSLIPSQTIYHLGFIWNSLDLTLSVPKEKISDLKSLCAQALSKPVSLRFLNKILGTVESFKMGFPYAALYYRGIQREVASYISNNFNWDDRIILSKLTIDDLLWWVSCPTPLPAKSLSPFIPDIVITTDSSETGWGRVEKTYQIFSEPNFTEQKFSPK